MLKAITTVAAGVLLALSSQPLMAVGFGRLVNVTTLGQSLDVSVALGADVNEQITSNCVSADVVVGDSALPQPAVRTRLEPAGSSGARVLRVTTTVRIHEPIVHVTVSVACPSRVSRQFVVFVDPPLTAFEPGIPMAEPVAVAAAPVAAASAAPIAAPSEPMPVRGEDGAPGASAVAPLPGPVATPPARLTARSAASKAASAKAAAARRSQAAARKARRASALDARSRSVPRLQLERGSAALSVAPIAATAPALVASAASPTPVAASATGPTDVERTAELQQEAIRSLQQRLEKLQAESEASGKSIAQLQARLEKAEASRSTGWLGYVLAAVAAALLLWIGLLIGRRASAARRGPTWWNADATSVPSAPTGAVTNRGFVPGAMASLPETVEIPDDTPTTDPIPLVTTEVLSPANPLGQFGDSVAPLEAAPVAEPSPAVLLTADELIDLEQQAAFFVALGQDDSAVDLLNDSLRSHGGASPLPHLTLLEIHRRRGERDAYERIRERFERRFDVPAPAWADAPVAGAIDDHAQVMRQIESVWTDPTAAMRLIESLLVSSDRTHAPFDLSTFADLQFLYLFARAGRDAGEPVSEATVDLLLPLSHRDAPRSVVASASRPTPHAGVGAASADSGYATSSGIDLELDFSPPPADPKPMA